MKTQDIKSGKQIKDLNFQNNRKYTSITDKSKINNNDNSSNKSSSIKCNTNLPITRENIRSALNQVYSEETKPVNVGNIKTRSMFALFFIYFGTLIILFSIGLNYYTLDPNLVIPGFILLVITFIIGLVVTTQNPRKIYNSMSRFKDKNAQVYRTVFPRSAWKSHALVYSTLICLMFLGAQSLNIFIISNPQLGTEDDQSKIETIDIKEGMIWIDYLEVGEPRLDSGQYYRFVTVIINNSFGYYSKNLNLIIQSNFAGDIHDRINLTLDQPDSDISAKIKIHEPDDTTILANLKFYGKNGVRQLDKKEKLSENGIYIKEATAEIIPPKTGIFTKKSIEMSVVIYNDRLTIEPETVSVVVSNPSVVGDITKGWEENNETINKNELWEVKFKFDSIDEEFKIKLNVKEKTKDEALVFAA